MLTVLEPNLNDAIPLGQTTGHTGYSELAYITL